MKMFNIFIKFFTLFNVVFKNLKSCSRYDSMKTFLPNLNMLKQSVMFQGLEEKKIHKNAEKLSILYDHPDLTSILPIIKNRFYFATLVPGKKHPRVSKNIYLFDIDDELVYNFFYDDFGPLNIACLYKYCHGVNQILRNSAHTAKLIVHYTSTNPEKRANAAYLVASYSVLCLNKLPQEAYAGILSKEGPSIRPFQDVSMGISHYVIKIIDCVRALKKATDFGFFNLNDFDIEEYEKYEQLRNGDLNWIVPRKFIAFLGPTTECLNYANPPEKYINYFLANEVTAVIRLNRKAYDAHRFTQAGIVHYEMFFPDGSIPPRKILKNFLQVAETTKGPLAVHCKAGLGRTGTLIAAYLIKHYGFTAKEAISWLRICRPGSVIGPQQTWLEDMESSLLQEGATYRLQYQGDTKVTIYHKRGIYSVAEKKIKAERRKLFFNSENVNNDSYSESARLMNLQAQRSDVHVRARPMSSIIGSFSEVGDNDDRKTMTQGDKLNQRKLRREKLYASNGNSNQSNSKFTSFTKKFFIVNGNSNT